MVSLTGQTLNLNSDKVQDDEKLSLAVWTPDPSDHTELYFLFRFLLTWKILLAF